MNTLLTLIVTPELEETVTDWLLMHVDIKGFTSTVADGHGSNHPMSVAEQVSGRRKQVMFRIALESNLTEQIMADLKRDFSGHPIHYWLTPIIEQGSFAS